LYTSHIFFKVPYHPYLIYFAQVYTAEHVHTVSLVNTLLL